MKYAVQLYTIRDEIHDKESFKEALKKVAEIGFEAVEFAGYWGLSADEMQDALNEAGLKAISSHENLQRFEENKDEFFPYLKSLGVKQVAMSYSACDSKSEIERTIKALEEAKPYGEKYGLEVLYHNHGHEFKNIEGIIPINEIKKVCKLELDSFWSYVAGENSAEYIKANKDIIPSIHIKDGSREKGHPMALGEGDNDIKAIIQTAEKLGHEWIILENDFPNPRGFDDITRSMKWLKENI